MARRDYDFALDGVPASSFGIHLQRPVSFSAAVPRVQTFTLAGKSGDLHIDENAYNNRTGTAKCFALDGFDVTSRMQDISSFLFSAKGYRKLTVSEDKDHYWYARVANAGEIAPRLNKLNPFTITFDCKPFRYINGSEEFVTDTVFTNPTGITTYPLIHIERATAGAYITSGIGVIQFPDGAYDLYIDCEDCVATNDQGVSRDQYILCEVFPRFYAGTNTIQPNGVESFEIAPRWRTI